MNPLTNVRNLAKLNERELEMGIAGDAKRSWHGKYRDSAWIFMGGLPYDLSEGDIIAVFSQYGEIVNINLIRDHKTGKSKGFGFLCYEDQKSTILAVDNFNGIKLLNRIIRVDHVEEYRVPKEHEDVDEQTKQLWLEGCAPKPVNDINAADTSDIDVKQTEEDDTLLPLNASDLSEIKGSEEGETKDKKKKKEKKAKKAKKKEKKKKKRKREKDEATSSKRRHRSASVDESSSSSSDDGGGIDAEKWTHKKNWNIKRESDEDGKDRRWTKNKRMGDDDNWGDGEGYEYQPPPPKKEFADWREKEMFKLERERERQKTGEEMPKKKDDESYLPSRYRR